MGQTRRMLLGAGGAAAGAAFSAACGAGATGAPEGAGPAAGPSRGPGPAAVQLWDIEQQAYQGFIAQWLPLAAARQPRVAIEYSPRPPQWQEKLTAAMVAGTPPDVVAVFGGLLRTFMADRLVLPLDRYIRAAKFDAEDFPAAVYKGFAWKGEQFGIPQYLNTSVIVYNREHFKRAGVPFPAEDWTQEQLLDAARKLTRGSLPNREVWGFDLLSWSATSRFLPLVWARCGEINDPNDPGVFTFAKRENVAAFQWLHDLRWKEHLAAGTDAARGGADTRQALYATGTLAMAADSTAAFSKWKFDAVTDWAIAPLPRGACGRGEWSAMDGYMIPGGTKVPDAAWTAVLELTGKEANRLRAEAAVLGPARKSQFGVWGKLLPDKNMQHAVPTDAARPEVSALWPRAEEVGRATTPIFTSLLAENILSVPDALKQLAEAVAGVLGPAAVRQ